MGVRRHADLMKTGQNLGQEFNQAGRKYGQGGKGMRARALRGGCMCGG